VKNISNFFFFHHYFNALTASTQKKWAIADVHGCYYTLKNLIEEKIQPSQEDIIYFLGDYIDRGTGSKQIIDYIIQLQEADYQVVALKGNHEDVMIRGYYQAKEQNKQVGFFYLEDSWLNYGGDATLKSFEVDNLKDIPQKYIDYLEKLPYYQEEEKTLLVHAGLNFSAEDPFSDELSMLWAKNFKVIPEKIDNKILIHGHVPEKLSNIQRKIEKQSPNVPISIDNGCIYKGRAGQGNLVALELNSFDLLVQPNVEEKVERNIKHNKTRYTYKINQY